jgi:hypothetical protein
MSIATGVWRQTLERASDLRKRALAVPSAWKDQTKPGPSQPALVALVQQLFFTAAQRNRILFVSADGETQISKFCEQVGSVLAEISHANVLIAAGNSASHPEPIKMPADATGAPAAADDTCVQLTGNLWRTSFDDFITGPGRKTNGGVRSFEYFLFAADIGDAAAKSLYERCDGAVLVITANHTRREAALRAKDVLNSWNVEMLGTVLDRRTFPVPESIYRRL